MTLRSALPLALIGWLAACSPERASSSTDEPSSSLVSAPLPTVRDDAAGLTFIWVDEAGAFHTGASLAEIPEGSRELVRVISEIGGIGSADKIFAARLREKKPDGSYPVLLLPRAEWEARGAAARQARLAKLKEPEAPAAATPGALGVDAIVYGASWCKPCHLAEDYLKGKGARVLKKDIEDDPKAGAEMRQKLAAAGLGGASIPVLDVGGILLVGFSPNAVDAALKRASAR